MTKKTTSKSSKPSSKTTKQKSQPQPKPKPKPKSGASGKAAAQAQQSEPKPSKWTLLVRLVPIVVLLAVILILAPSLPLRLLDALVDGARTLLPGGPPPADPVFTVEGASGVPVLGDAPTPDWHGGLASTFTPEVQVWAPQIQTWSETYRLKPNLIATLMQIESCGDPTARSASGKLGLFQVPADEFRRRDDPFDPDTNAEYALTRFAEMYEAANGDLALAFAAYNGGRDVIDQSPAEWPDETKIYQYWAAGIYEEAERGLSQSPTLVDWLRAGGSNLCATAADVLEFGPAGH